MPLLVTKQAGKQVNTCSELWNKNTTLTLKAPTPQNDQTHSKNVSAIADELFVFDLFVGLALKGLMSTDN